MLNPAGECSECGRRRSRRFMASPFLCKKCAAKRRPPVFNPERRLPNGVVLTRRVERSMRRQAYGDNIVSMYQARQDRVGMITACLTIASIYIALFRMDSLGFATLVAVPSLGGVICLILHIPKERRIRQVVRDLAIERRDRLVEYQAFYTSSDWIRLRNKVVREEGSRCGICGRAIRKEEDITVDHIKPRSKYPLLALERSNLRVVCRQCNSAKGAEEYDDPSADPSLPGCARAAR
jgi:5-methylcytosine-specific restriction endonuclease McrA